LTAPFRARKKLFLPRTFQGKLARRIAAYWVLYHLAMWHSMFFVDYVTSQAIFSISNPRVSFGRHYLLFARQNWTLAMWAVVIGPIVVWQCIVYSHRIVGPLVRLERTLLRMAEGESVPPLKFRDGDFAVGLEQAFNAYLTSLPATNPSATPAANPPLEARAEDESAEIETLELLNKMHAELSASLQPASCELTQCH
jgi:hypothetical protein